MIDGALDRFIRPYPADRGTNAHNEAEELGMIRALQWLQRLHEPQTSATLTFTDDRSRCYKITSVWPGRD